MRMEFAMSSIHSPLLSHSLSEFLRPVPVKRRPIRAFFTRLAHAWRLARNRLTEEDARALYLQCQNKLGWYTLDLLTTSDAIEAAREVFNDNPELPASSRKPAPLSASAGTQPKTRQKRVSASSNLPNP